MDIAVKPGTYVVAVSGGVDSVTLLDMLRQQPDLKLIVAHFDHGIRHDSKIDRELVQAMAKQHNLPFVYYEGGLGPDTSEQAARRARYDFLHKVRAASGAQAIITAHHGDDALETAVINLLRGTGRKGLSSLRSRTTVHRPLLGHSKQQLRDYAQSNGLVWREDSTNADTRYLRNHVRHDLLPKLSTDEAQKLAKITARMAEINEDLDTQLLHYLHTQSVGGKLDRTAFLRLPHAVAMEVMATWLRSRGVRDFDQKILERLVVGAKTLPPAKSLDVIRGRQLIISRDHLALHALDR